jgi:hypothetical protein
MANITYRVDTAEVDVPKTFPNPALQVTESEEAGSTKPGPTLENERAGRRGFLQGWLDENWARVSAATNTWIAPCSFPPSKRVVVHSSGVS